MFLSEAHLCASLFFKASISEGGGPREAWWKEYKNSFSQLRCQLPQ